MPLPATRNKEGRQPISRRRAGTEWEKSRRVCYETMEGGIGREDKHGIGKWLTRKDAKDEKKTKNEIR